MDAEAAVAALVPLVEAPASSRIVPVAVGLLALVAARLPKGKAAAAAAEAVLPYLSGDAMDTNGDGEGQDFPRTPAALALQVPR